MRRAAAGDDGISLAEVLVAITILALTMTATATSVIAALRVSRDSREAVIGANIAQYELERLRSIPFADWVVAARSGPGDVVTTTERASGPDGQVYDVTREARWVAAGAAQTSCEVAASGQDGGTDHVRVSQTVVFPDRDIEPVTNVTILTPRSSAYDPFAGNLSVHVTDRDGVGASGHEVRVTGASGLEVAVTDADGCASFGFLSVDPANPPSGGYAISIQTAGHVTPAGQTAISDRVTVTAQSTTVRRYRYDRSAAIAPVPTTTPPAAGCAMALVDTGIAPTGGGDATKYPAGGSGTFRALECRDDGVAVPPGWQARVPLNLGYGLSNPSSAFSASGLRPIPPTDVQVAPSSVQPLFPFTGGYGIAAGRCQGSDPTTTGAPSRQQVASDPGGSAGVSVQMALVTITTTEADGVTPIGGVDVHADHRNATTCATGERLYLGRSDASGRLLAVMPYGEWVVFWRQNGAGPGQRYACGDVAQASSCVTLRADAAPNPVSGVPVRALRNP